jgi:hypothetical protein
MSHARAGDRGQFSVRSFPISFLVRRMQNGCMERELTVRQHRFAAGVASGLSRTAAHAQAYC